MTNTFARKGLQLIPTILGVVTLVFLMVRFLPGDPATYIAGENAPQSVVETLREKLDLNSTIEAQYWHYVKSTVQLDLGRSLLTGRPVKAMIGDALPTTLLLGTVSLFLSFAIAVPLGATAAFLASKGKGAFDQALTMFVMVIDMVPGFWLALVLLLVVSLKLQLLPATGPMPWGDPLMLAKRIALPVLVLSVGPVATIARITRAAVLEVLSEDYIRTARAMGAPDRSVLFTHALRNAALPVVTIAGLGFGRLLGGTVIIETIFALPGMGTILINGINGRDYPVVQGLVLMYASLFVFVNLATDLIYTKVDPRVKL
jgi:ABC-type dipeptide/oligopeptide/nickel transport system permease component